MPNLLARYFRLKEGQESLPPGTREMGLVFMLASLGMLFASMLVGYFTVRWMAGEWPPPGTPKLPAGLWAGTAVLILGSLSIHRALAGIRAGSSARLAVWLRWTLILGLLFLGIQGLNWAALIKAHGGPTDGMYGFLFFVLTMLHGVHVVAGLLPLGVALSRVRTGRYTAGSHHGIRSLAIYWHFLGLTWLVLFAVLYLADRP
ncbi:MAG: cytochrome c oxidase subunit 3 [Acidobacteria bacterium]|uniref:Cytochrome c oxidase subunit 3 n=1 Tax=Candidatus Polarisedimenticola svalbardensis TaxID=2886004 RepID=A0A8J6XZ15_9BACT|nr:cytochrome c oxidase subunit 3 [Candidatus Polarisedimenticola svalbardensis]